MVSASQIHLNNVCQLLIHSKTPVTQEQHSHPNPMASKKNAENVKKIVDAVGSHRTPNKGAHFEHAKKKTLSLCVLIRAQWGCGNVSDNAIGAPRVRINAVEIRQHSLGCHCLFNTRSEQCKCHESAVHAL